MSRFYKVLFVFLIALWPINLFAYSEPGSSDWHFDVSKTIALELADSPSWSLAAVYLRDIGSRSQDWNVLLLQAKVELQQGNLEGATAAIDKALKIHPKNPRILAMAGNIALDRDELDKAETYYLRVLEQQPYQVPVLMSLTRIYYARQNWQGVVRTYEQYQRVTAPTSEMLVRMATACERLGDVTRAESLLFQNLDTHINRLTALIALERFYQRTGQTARADAIAQDRIRLQKKQDNDSRMMRALPSSSK